MLIWRSEIKTPEVPSITFEPLTYQLVHFPASRLLFRDPDPDLDPDNTAYIDFISTAPWSSGAALAALLHKWVANSDLKYPCMGYIHLCMQYFKDLGPHVEFIHKKYTPSHQSQINLTNKKQM